MSFYDSLCAVCEVMLGPFLSGTPNPGLAALESEPEASSKEKAVVMRLQKALEEIKQARLAEANRTTTTSQGGQTTKPKTPVPEEEIVHFPSPRQHCSRSPEEKEKTHATLRTLLSQLEAAMPESDRTAPFGYKETLATLKGKNRAAATQKESSSNVEDSTSSSETDTETSVSSLEDLERSDTLPLDPGSHSHSSREEAKALGVKAGDGMDASSDNAPAGTQSEELVVEADPALWRSEFLCQRLFIHRLCQALLAHGIRIGVEYTPNPLPGIKHRFVNVSSVEMSAPGDGEVLKHKLLEVDSNSAKPTDGEGSGNDAAVQVSRKGLFSQHDLEALVNDPQAQEALRDVIIVELARHGITVNAQFNNNEVILRLTGITNGPVRDTGYLNRVQELLWERTPTFRQDLRSKWGRVQQLLAEKAAWFSEPYPFSGDYFDIVRNVSNKTCTATFSGPEEQLLRDVRQILYASGIFTHFNEARTSLAFEDVEDDIDCLSIAIRCALLYKKAVLKLDGALHNAYTITLHNHSSIRSSSSSSSNEPAFPEKYRGKWLPRDRENDERRFYEAFRATLQDYRNIIKRRVGAISELLADYEEKKTACLKTGNTMALKSLLSTALKNTIAAREASSFSSALTSSIPAHPPPPPPQPHPRGSQPHEGRFPRRRRGNAEREGPPVVVVDELLHEISFKEVQVWEWRAKHAKQAAEVGAVRNSEADLRRTVAYLQVHQAAFRGQAEDLEGQLRCEKGRAADLETQVRTRDKELREGRQATAAAEARAQRLNGLVQEREGEVYSLQVQLATLQQQQQSYARDDMWTPLPDSNGGGTTAAIRVFETYPDGVSVVSRVDAENFSSALCTLLERRLAPQEQENENVSVNVNESGSESESDIGGESVTRENPEDDIAVQIVSDDLKSQKDAEYILIRRTREVAKLRIELGEAQRKNEELTRQLESSERSHTQAAVQLADVEMALAQEKGATRHLEGELEDLASLSNALEVQLMDHLQVTEIQRYQQTSDVRPRSSSVVEQRILRSWDESTTGFGLQDSLHPSYSYRRRPATMPIESPESYMPDFMQTPLLPWNESPEYLRQFTPTPQLPQPPVTPMASPVVVGTSGWSGALSGGSREFEEQEAVVIVSSKKRPLAESGEQSSSSSSSSPGSEEEGSEHVTTESESSSDEDDDASSFAHVEEYEGEAESQSGESSAFEDLEGAESVHSLSSGEDSSDGSDWAEI